MGKTTRRPILGAGLVCFKGDSVLLIKRGKPPFMGEWSIPGGHVEWGETTPEAALRETFEETGVCAEIVCLIDVVDSIRGQDGEEGAERHYVLIDYAAHWISGDPVAGDDASHAEFVPLSSLDDIGLWAETVRVIRQGAHLLLQRR